MSRPSLTWTRLHLPIPLTFDAAHAAIAALAGVSGQPRIVLEVTGHAGAIAWRLGCQDSVRPRVLHALGTQLPGLRTEPESSTLDGLRPSLATSVRVVGSRQLPLDRQRTEPAVRGLLGALSRARKTEAVHVQLVLGARSRPSHPPIIDQARKRATTEKHREHRFACAVRVAALAQDPARSRTLIQGVIGSLRQLEVPGVRIHVVRTSVGAFNNVRSPFLWPNSLSLSDVVPLTGWPVSDKTADPLPGVPDAHPRLIAPDSTIKKRGRVVGVATTSPDREIAISVEDSLRHLHVLGPTGVGKSTLIAHLALGDIASGRGVVVIDPKADLVDDILARADESRLDDIVVIDARDAAPVGINPLSDPRDPDLAADILLGTFHSLYESAWGPRTHDVLHAALLTLARRGDASLAMVPLLISHPGFRRSVIGLATKSDPMGLGSFWSSWDGMSEAERSQASAPLMRRLRPVLMRPGLRGIFGQRRPKFDLSEVFTKNKVLLVSLAKGTIGPEAAALLGSLIVSQLWMAALARAGTPASRRRPVMIAIDEVQDYLRLPGDLGDALAQARGLGIGYTLAHQHLGQLPKSVHDAAMANARSRVAFQLSAHDAREIAGLTRDRLAPADFEALPAFKAYAQLLADNTPGHWVSLDTQPLPPPLRDPEAVRARSRARYGQPLSDIEADLLSLVEPARAHDEPIGRVPRSQTNGAST